MKTSIIVGLILIGLIGTETALAADAAPVKRPFFLPKNPVAAAYVLGRLSNQELIGAPRGEFVYEAILKRNGLERKHRMEALKGLAEIRKTGVLEELMSGLIDLDAKGDEAIPVLRELGGILLQRKPEELIGKRADLEKVATASEQAISRQIGYAALASGDQAIEKAWELAESAPSRLADLIAALPMIRDPRIRTEARARVEPYLQRSENPEIRRAAITAVSSMPGSEAATFATLSGLVRSGIEIETAIKSLQRLPKNAWPEPEVEPLVSSLMDLLSNVPSANRTEDSFLNAIQFASDLASLLPTAKAAPTQKFLRDLGVQVIVIRTVPEQMLYDKQLLVVEAGKPVEIILVNDDAMQHNLVVVLPGSVEEIGTAAEAMPPEADAQGRLYVPASPKVLHATSMLNFGETARLSFVAPEEPGEYNYVCTFPGHWRRMFGTLAVVPDVDAYLADHPARETPQMREWTLTELEPDLVKIDSGRDLAEGRKLFTNLACAQCHKLGEEGYAFGPELTDIFERWNGDYAAVLREILEPSGVIADPYKSTVLETDDGESVSGLILKEDSAGLTIHAGPSPALIQTIPKSTIESRKVQDSSLMPVGLLGAATKEQILDLLAYLKARGVVQRSHQH